MMNKWMFSIFRLLLIALPWLSGYVPASSAETVMSRDEAVALTPRLTLEDKDISSYGMRLKLAADNGANLDMLVFEARSEKRGLILFDPTDGTPMLVVLDDEMLYYDPLQGGVVLSRGYYSLQLSNRLEGDGKSELNLGFAISGKKDDEDVLRQNLIDVRSIISTFESSEISIREVEPDNYVAIGTSKGGTPLKAVFERRDGRGHFKWLALLAPPDGGGVNMLFQLINMNTPVASKWFKMPDKELADAGLQIVDERAETNTKPLSLNGVVLSIMMRLMPDMPDDAPEKKKLESYLPKDFDWNLFAQQDKKASQILRTIYANGTSLESLSPH